MEKKPGLSTLCVHAGEPEGRSGAPHTPIFATTTFKFPSTAALLDVVDGRAEGGFYTRYGMNPTIEAVEDKLASLEGAESALVFTSGLAAISSLFLAHGRKGIVCVGDAYGGTLEILTERLPPLGFTVHSLFGSERRNLESTLGAEIGLVFLESPTNPALDVQDIQSIAEIAHRRGALVAVDNTFASPVNQNPLALGADLVVHSATKFLGGHSDLTAGAVMCGNALREPIWQWRKSLGQTPAPDTCWLLARSLRTLVVRVERQNKSAMAVAQAMNEHPRVKRVYYPGLEGSPGFDIARKQMRGFGGMVTIELSATAEETTNVVDKLRLIVNAPSLGGVESLATQPFATTHHGLSPEARAARGISDGMIRLSIGLEDPEDLISDLRQALE